jgi:hypothetical protein
VILSPLTCPALAWIFKHTYGDTESAALRFSTSVSQNTILIGAISSTGVLVFCMGYYPSHFLYALFTIMYSFTVGAGPALYTLGTAYFLALGRRDEIGSLFGALAVWGVLGQYVSVRRCSHLVLLETEVMMYGSL